MRILLDMDGVIVNLLPHWVRLINRYHGENLDPANITEWSIHKLCQGPDAADKVYEFFKKPGFFLHLDPMPGAIAGVNLLLDAGFEVVIVTACKAGHADKRKWIERHLPRLPKRNIVFAERKELVVGDVFVDDHAENCRAYKDAHALTTVICFDAPHNRAYPGLRAHTWAEVAKHVGAKALRRGFFSCREEADFVGAAQWTA